MSPPRPSLLRKVVKEGAYWICPAGLACPAQLVGRLVHYASRDALDIEGLGHETARQLVERGLVHDVADLYALETGDLVGLEGFAEKSAKALRDAIARSRSVARAVARFFRASQNRRVLRNLAKRGVRTAVAPRGRRAAKLSGKTFVFSGRLERFTRAEAREAVEGFGGRTASSVSGATDYLVVGRRRVASSTRPGRGASGCWTRRPSHGSSDVAFSGGT